MSEEGFEPNEYWESRLQQHWGLNAVGFLGLGDAYNHALYQVKGHVFRRTVRHLPVILETASVLDIGSGTGFVVDQWRQLGAIHLYGSDLSSFAVNKLGDTYPQYKFVELDIGKQLDQNLLSPDSFDYVSALDVLYHIVDDEAYKQALANISNLLHVGGYFLLADNFLQSETIRGRHQVSHSFATLQTWLSEVGLEIVERTPQYFLMNYPIDSKSRLLHHWWQWLSKQVARSERRGSWLGKMLVPLEIALTSILSEGPSTELAVCKKVDGKL